MADSANPAQFSLTGRAIGARAITGIGPKGEAMLNFRKKLPLGVLQSL